jgi:O-antigen/teichoic acid export membrane protein
VTPDKTVDLQDGIIVEDIGDDRPSILRNMAHLMSSQIVSWVLGTVAQIIQPRFLGPEGLGQLRLAFSVWLIAQVFITLGTSTYLTLEFARDRQRGASLVGPIANLRVVAFLAASALIAVYLVATGADGMTWALFGVVGSTMLLGTLGDTLASALNGMEQMGYPALAGAVSKFVYTLVMVAVLLIGGGAIGVAATTTLNVALSLVLLWHYYRKFARVSFRQSAIGYGEILRSSLPFVLGGAIIVLYLQVDTIMISELVDERTLGWYGTADVLASSLLFIPAIIMATLFPVIGRLHEHDSDASASIVRRAFSFLFLTGVAIGFGTFIVAEPFMVWLYGEPFRESGDVLGVFGISMPLLFATMMLGTVAMATGRQRFWNWLMAIALVMSVGLDFVLVPWTRDVANNGALGGAMAYVVTELFMVIIGVWRLAPETFRGDSLIRLLKILTAGGLMVVAAWPLNALFLPVPIAVGTVVFIGAIHVFGILTDDERDMVRRLAARVGIGGTHPGEPDAPTAAEVAPVSTESGGPR